MRTLENERKLRDLRRQVAGLSQHDRQALGNNTVGEIMDQQTQQEIEAACDIGAVLRACVDELTLSGETTIGAIANATGLNAAPLYRWFDHGADLKLASVVRLCQYLELQLVACDCNGRWDRSNGQRTLRDRTPLTYAARFPHAATPPPAATAPSGPTLARVSTSPRKAALSPRQQLRQEFGEYMAKSLCKVLGNGLLDFMRSHQSKIGWHYQDDPEPKFWKLIGASEKARKLTEDRPHRRPSKLTEEELDVLFGAIFNAKGMFRGSTEGTT